RRHVSHTAERPQYNLICLATDLPTSQRVTKLVHQHNAEQADRFERVPAVVMVIDIRARLNTPKHNQKPRPVQVNIDPKQPENAHGASIRRHADLSHVDYGCTSFLPKSGPPDALFQTWIRKLF